MHRYTWIVMNALLMLWITAKLAYPEIMTSEIQWRMSFLFGGMLIHAGLEALIRKYART